MIAIDSNILIYAHQQRSPWNRAATDALGNLVASGAPWAIPWTCLHEFYAVVTNPKLRPCSTVGQGVAQIDAWLEAPTLVLLAEDVGTWPVLRGLITAGQIDGPHVYDARIAAVCIQHHVSELWTADRDFTRFPSLRARNPLIDPTLVGPTRPTGGRASEPRATYQIGRSSSAKSPRRRVAPARIRPTTP